MTTTEATIEHSAADLSADVPQATIPIQVDSDQDHSTQALGTEDGTTIEVPEDLELLWADPSELFVGANTRTNAGLDKEFLADIKARGVQEPIKVYRDGDGRLVVRKGQRRTLAAIAGGRSLVPILVGRHHSDDEREREITRIIDQLAENEHRSPIGEADELQATQQLLNLGLSAAQIAKARHIKVARVKTAVAVVRTDVALQAVLSGGLDLVQAAALTEFADDEHAVKQLTDAAVSRPEQFDHIIQRLRDEREDAALVEAAVGPMIAALTEAGVTIIDPPEDLHSGPIRPLSRLRESAETKDGTPLTAEQHSTCPGHAGFIVDRGNAYSASRFDTIYVCTAHKDHGHAPRWNPHTPAGRVPGPMSEAEKAERRLVIANNKAWGSAEKVRLAWLTKFARRKRAPKDAALWVAKVLATGSHNVRKAMEGDHALAVRLLGLSTGESRFPRREAHLIVDALDKADPARTTVIMTVIMAAAMEAGTDRSTWRTPNAEAVAYFTRLRDWGYTLSPVEQTVLTPKGAAAAAEIPDSDLTVEITTDSGDEVVEDTQAGEDEDDPEAPDNAVDDPTEDGDTVPSTDLDADLAA